MLPEYIQHKILLYRETHPVAKLISIYCDRYRKPTIQWLDDGFTKLLYISPSFESRGRTFIHYLKYILDVIGYACSSCHKKYEWEMLRDGEWYRRAKHPFTCLRHYTEN